MRDLSSDVVGLLFQPFSVGSLLLPNRIVMAPMTREQSPDGVPGPNVAAYYARRAANNVGLIITEGTVVDHPSSASSANVPRFYGDAALAGWAGVRQAVHEAGGRIMVQLWHVGADRKVDNPPIQGVPPSSPSGLDLTGKRVGEPMSDSDIADVIAAFATAAGHARRLGFDGIELHGAHGYLIDQFLWSQTNRRTDRYGGDLVARTRFAAEVVAACRRAVGPDFPISFRFSQWKISDFSARLVESPQELELLLEPLVTAGVDLFHCSTRRFWLPEFDGAGMSLAAWVKKLTGKATIAVGSVGLDNSEFQTALLQGKGADNAALDDVAERMLRGEFDLVAVGRALLADPAWATKIRYGRTEELVPFTVSALAELT